jgi:hypothetical protein
MAESLQIKEVHKLQYMIVEVNAITSGISMLETDIGLNLLIIFNKDRVE